MSLHLGLHWNMVLGMFQKNGKDKKEFKNPQHQHFLSLVLLLPDMAYGYL